MIDSIEDRIEVYIDGAAKGNPGPAGIGIVICKVQEIKQYIGRVTNNVAEYKALITALKHLSLSQNNKEEIIIYTDSQLLVRQLNGIYKVKSLSLQDLYREVKELEKNFKKISYHYIGREKNKKADLLANQAIREYKKGGTKSGL